MSESLVDRVRRLRADVAVHKSAIGKHRRQLHEAKARLAELEAECARHGIAIVIVPPVQPIGEGVLLHGHKSSP
jgi:hypothetical protein